MLLTRDKTRMVSAALKPGMARGRVFWVLAELIFQYNTIFA
jgi:hypothetical protein